MFDCLGLLYSILFNCMIFLYCPPALRDILPTSMARHSLFVLKVPLNTKQTNSYPLCIDGYQFYARCWVQTSSRSPISNSANWNGFPLILSFQSRWRLWIAYILMQCVDFKHLYNHSSSGLLSVRAVYNGNGNCVKFVCWKTIIYCITLNFICP